MYRRFINKLDQELNYSLLSVRLNDEMIDLLIDCLSNVLIDL